MVTRRTNIKHQAARSPLSVWELPKLATLVHTYRKSKTESPKCRSHYPAILAFVYRNRLAIASQIQRRFPDHLPSDRTARRHLAEMESLGLLGVQTVNGVSPLMPKPYFVTQTGLRHLRRAYEKQGVDWQPYLRDRRRSNGQSFPHVWHELATTEFLLSVHETVSARTDLELPVIERRSLVRHPDFELKGRGQSSLRPDALFVFSHRRARKMCCLLEIDTGAESEAKLLQKLRAYGEWMHSPRGRQYLVKLYKQCGAKRPRAVFRLLFVTSAKNSGTNNSRSSTLCRLLLEECPELAERTWITSTECFVSDSVQPICFDHAIWMRAVDHKIRTTRDGRRPVSTGQLSLFPRKT